MKLPSALVCRALLHLLLANASKQRKKPQKMCLWEYSFVLNVLRVNWLVFVVFPLLLEDIARCFFSFLLGIRTIQRIKVFIFTSLLSSHSVQMASYFFLIKKSSRKTKKQWWMWGMWDAGGSVCLSFLFGEETFIASWFIVFLLREFESLFFF